MTPTKFAGPLALALGLLFALDSPRVGAQGPTVEPGNPPPSPGGVTLGTPVPAGESAPAPVFPCPTGPDPGMSVEAPPVPPPTMPEVPALDASGRMAGGFSPFFNPTVGHAPFLAAYGVAWFPSEPVSGQPTNLGFERHDLLVSCPIYQDDCNEWLASVNVRGEIFQTHAILPTTGQAFPDELWNVRFGATYRHLFDNGWIAGGTMSVGSASDRPFHAIDEMTAGVNAFLRVPQGDHNAWLFTLTYSPTSELPVPLPGVAYVWQPSEYFRANLGLPFQLMWRPTDELTLDLSYMLLTTVHARATYRLCRPVRLYAGYDWENESYFLVDRPDTNDRFFYVDQRLSAGVQYFFSPQASLDMSGGYVFDRHYFEGKNITSGTGFNRVDVGDGPYLSLQFRLRW